MKRLLLILILLFPIVTLVIWVYLGMFKSGRQPIVPALPNPGVATDQFQFRADVALT